MQDPNLLLGLDHPDDAGVYKVSETLALVQTVDFFTPIVDDAYDWGAIAAANALSGVYAMGGQPLLGLNLVGWPRDLDPSLLARVLEGGADKASEAGALILGGHTIDDQEPKFGMAVTGTIHPDRVVRTSGARPGAVLVLTKPLSMGIVATALKRGAVSDELVRDAVAVMASLNAGAAEAMMEVGAAAATDVTGFGLLGHLYSMVRWEGVGAEVWFDRVPVLEGVHELAAQGFVPGGTDRNAAYFGQFVDFDPDVDPLQQKILFDPQTSGGLLIAVEEDKAPELIAGLAQRGTAARAIVGRITDGPGARITVRARRS